MTRKEVEERVIASLDEGHGGWIVTANLDILRQCHQQPRLADLVSAADMVVADGTPLVWATRLARTDLPERVAGSDLIWSLSDRLGRAERSIYLLGGSDGAAIEAADRLRRRTPGLVIAGHDCPPFGFERSEERVTAVVDRLVVAQPDVAFVGLGFPKQDELIARMVGRCPTTWFVGVGVSIDFVAGRVQRAPAWTHRTGLEWLYRLYREPRKLFRRYVVHDIPFAGRVLRWALRKRRDVRGHR